jgi:hypothetical protein
VPTLVSNEARNSAGATSFSAAGFFSFAFAAALNPDVEAVPRPRPAGFFAGCLAAGFAGCAVAGFPGFAGAVPPCAAAVTGIAMTAAIVIIVVKWAAVIVCGLL